jgi:hypothetical protein
MWWHLQDSQPNCFIRHVFCYCEDYKRTGIVSFLLWSIVWIYGLYSYAGCASLSLCYLQSMSVLLSACLGKIQWTVTLPVCLSLTKGKTLFVYSSWYFSALAVLPHKQCPVTFILPVARQRSQCGACPSHTQRVQPVSAEVCGCGYLSV